MGNILIVDDEKSIRLTIKAFLEDDGHQLYTAENVATALVTLRENDIDVVVTDIIMPRISGVDLLRRIKEIKPEIQVIVITGEPSVGTATEAMRQGAADYLIKPISKIDIKKIVFNAVRLKKLREEKTRLGEENQRYQENLEEMVVERTKALTESEARFRNMSNLLPQTIFEINNEGQLMFINSNGLKTFGISQQTNLSDLNIRSLFSVKEQNQFNEFLEGLKNDSGIEDHEFIAVTQKGEQFPVHLYASRIVVDEVVSGYQGIIIDITQQKKIENELRDYHTHLKELVAERTKQLQQKQAQLIHSGRLAALGEMATGIAHELNQPLAIIRGQAEVMKIIQRKYTDPLPDFSEELTTIMEQTDRAALIIEEMRGFVRQDEHSINFTDITEPIDKGLVFFREQFLANNIKFSASIPDNLPKVKVSSQQFEQVIVNLLSNARYAVETMEKSASEKYQKIISLKVRFDTKNSKMNIELKDNGIGMDEEEKERCLEPFFTKRPVGQGSGLGLTIAYGIINSFSGSLTIESKLGKGTTVIIGIPIPL